MTVGRQRVEEERRPQLRAAPAVHLKTKAVGLDRAGGAARHARRAHAPAKRGITWRASSSMERSTCLAHRTANRGSLGSLAVRPGWTECRLPLRTPPQPDTGTARFTGAKAGVGTAIAL